MQTSHHLFSSRIPLHLVFTLKRKLIYFYIAIWSTALYNGNEEKGSRPLVHLGGDPQSLLHYFVPLGK